MPIEWHGAIDPSAMDAAGSYPNERRDKQEERQPQAARPSKRAVTWVRIQHKLCISLPVEARCCNWIPASHLLRTLRKKKSAVSRTVTGDQKRLFRMPLSPAQEPPTALSARDAISSAHAQAFKVGDHV